MRSARSLGARARAAAREAAATLWRFAFAPAESSRPARRDELLYAAVLAGCVALPALLAFDPRGGSVAAFGLPLPSTCMTQQLFHVECPGCGLTRSFVLIAHGQFADSLRYHRLGVVLYAFFLVQIGVRLRPLLAPTRPLPQAFARVNARLPAILIVLLVLNWLAGVFVGSN